MNTVEKALPLNEFIIRHLHDIDKQLHELILTIAEAAKLIHVEIRKGALATSHEKNGTFNKHKEEMIKLDESANNTFIKLFKESKSCAAMGSEEIDDILLFEEPAADYIIYIDPLDGSSNIEVNSSVGSIFSAYRRKTQPVAFNDLLQKGNEQVVAGYMLYGLSTQLVFTTGRSVNAFTLDPATNEFYLTQNDIKCPCTGPVYSFNYARYDEFPKTIQNYCADAMSIHNSVKTTARYNGSFVADIHRILMKGGIFIYPPTKQHPAGKLRLMYECNPMAFIIGVAGGKAMNTESAILDLQAASIHENAVFIAGSTDMVDELIRV